MTQGVIIAPTTGTLSGAALVADENVAAQVEMTDNAGAGWPTAASLGLTSLSCVLAHNTANNQIAVRDIADTAWIVLGTVDEVNKAYSAALKTDTSLRTSAAGLWQANEPITSVAANTTVNTATHFANFVATAAVTFTLAQSTTLWNGCCCSAMAQGGAITLTASATVFLFVNRNTSTGALTYGATTLQPITQQGGTTSVVNGQYTFRTDQMVMYLGNGTTASPVQALFVGEAVTGASSVTSVVNYALLGAYDSGWITGLPGAGVYTSKSANLGTDSAIASMLAKCLSVDGMAYPVGTVIVPAVTTNIANNPVAPVQPSVTRTTVGVQAGATATGWAGGGGNGNNNASMTAASWSHRLIAKRSF